MNDLKQSLFCTKSVSDEELLLEHSTVLELRTLKKSGVLVVIVFELWSFTLRSKKGSKSCVGGVSWATNISVTSDINQTK